MCHLAIRSFGLFVREDQCRQELGTQPLTTSNYRHGHGTLLDNKMQDRESCSSWGLLEVRHSAKQRGFYDMEEWSDMFGEKEFSDRTYEGAKVRKCESANSQWNNTCHKLQSRLLTQRLINRTSRLVRWWPRFRRTYNNTGNPFSHLLTHSSPCCQSIGQPIHTSRFQKGRHNSPHHSE